MRHLIVAGSQPFRPSSMTKNGNQSLSSSWRDIGNWTADLFGYPGSVVNGHGVLAQATVARTTLTAHIPYGSGGGWGGPKQAVRILVNGDVVATGEAATSWSGTMTATASTYLAVGDRVSVQGWTTHSAYVLGGTDTYVRIAGAA